MTLRTVALLGLFGALCLSTTARAENKASPLDVPGPCTVADNGSGTIDFPPAPCAYATQTHYSIIDGLPPGTTIEVSASHQWVHCNVGGVPGACTITPGGNLGGERADFSTDLILEFRGTGDLLGFHRVLTMPDTNVLTDTAPRNPGDPIQTFQTDIFNLQGFIFGDPDFGQLFIAAGTNLGLPSPGSTTLTDLGDGTFQVESFFDINYQIDFIGAAGGALAGLTGSTMGTTRIEVGATQQPCVESDNGSGTIDIPPRCDWRGDPLQILDGLPPGDAIEATARITSASCAVPPCEQPGGNLGGSRQTYDAVLALRLNGLGDLDGFARSLRVPVAVVTDTSPRVAGVPSQTFVADLVDLQGSLAGDPDFATIDIVAGSANGLPSPGAVSLSLQPDGTYLVDSFFDIEYQIDFVGAAGSALEGLSGSTIETARMYKHETKLDAIELDRGDGTITLPPQTSLYADIGDPAELVVGLPPGSTIEVGATIRAFYCGPFEHCGGETGGDLGGEREPHEAILELELTGTGLLTGLTRSLQLPLSAESHSAPRTAGAAVQAFDTDIALFESRLVSDPDFAHLEILGGSFKGLPSPGTTELTDLEDGSFLVDSFFDISYQVHFVGAPGSVLDGLSGSQNLTSQLQACGDPAAPPPADITIVHRSQPPLDPTDFTYIGGIGTFQLDGDNDGTLPGQYDGRGFQPGRYRITSNAIADWETVDISCVGAGPATSVDLPNREVLVQLQQDQDVTCTFTQRNLTATIFIDGFESGDVAAWSTSAP